MKKLLFLTVVALTPCLGLAQNLTMAELIGFLKKDIADIEEIMTTKGWEMTELDIENPTFPTVTFAYERDTNEWSTSAGKAVSFLVIDFTTKTAGTDLQWRRVALQVHIGEKYNQYMNAIKSYKCRLIKTEVEDGCINKVYQGATTTFGVLACPAKSSTSVPTWHFRLYTNAFYNLMHQD